MSYFHDVNLLIDDLSNDNYKLVKYYDNNIETDYRYLIVNDFN